MGLFDQHARQAAKDEEIDFIAWVLSHGSPGSLWRFERWDDTRRTAWSGGPEHTNDLVAVLRHAERPDKFGRLIVEVELEPHPDTLHRIGVYELLLSRELLLAPDQGDVEVGSAILQLTGAPTSAPLQLELSGLGIGSKVEPIPIALSRVDANSTLRDIDAGRTGRGILPWIPLMSGSDDSKVMEEWKRVAMKDPDVTRRVTRRDQARVFAELTKWFVDWEKALGGWEMKESQLIRGWLDEGKNQGVVEAQRKDVLELVRLRLQDPVPDPIRLAVEGTNDPDMLTRWFRVAAVASSLDDLRAAMKTAP